MEDPQDSTMTLTNALQDLEFLVLAICPGASLTQNYKRQGEVTPSLLELLSWHCLHIHGLCPGRRPPYASPAVIQMLKDNMDRKVNVALICLGSSIPVSRQQHYDWLSRAREAYSLGPWELAGQTILFLESGVSGPLYDSRDKLRSGC